MAIIIPLIFVFMPTGPSYDAPGAPAGAALIKIGVLDDTKDITGEHAYKGAWMAAKEINDAGGVDVGGTTRYMGLIKEDTDEANPQVVPASGLSAAEKMIDVNKPDFILGGFRTESVVVYVEAIMDAKIPFIITGSATDIFTQNVIDDYDTYKYNFRNMPVNSTSLGGQLGTMIFGIVMPTINATLRALSGNATEFNNKYAIIYEQLDWTNSTVAGLSAAIGLYGGTVKTFGVPLTATSEDIIQIWNDVKTDGAQIAIPVFSSTLGVLMSSKYGEVKPNCTLIGINVPGQLDTFWDLTSGRSEYEILLQGMYNVSRTSLSVPFWNNFVGNYSSDPLYTAIGSHGAVYLFAQAAEDAGTLDADAIVTSLEKITPSNPATAAGGMFSFTPSHDVMSVMTKDGGAAAMTYSTTTLFVQWQADGKKVVISSGNAIYLDTLVTGTMQFPDWWIGS